MNLSYLSGIEAITLSGIFYAEWFCANCTTGVGIFKILFCLKSETVCFTAFKI